MNPESIALLQTHRAQRITGMPPGIDGSVLRWDGPMAAGMCSGMDRIVYLAGRAIYARDYSCIGPVQIHLFEEACKLAKRKKWSKVDGNRRIEAMVALALIESASLKLYKSDAERARAMDIHPSNYSREWRHRYADVKAILDNLIDEYQSHLRRKMRETA